MAAKKLTHLDERGRARMVDVGDKPVTARQAVAEGYVVLQPQTLQAIAQGTIAKGEVLNTARIAGTLAAKRTGELIPLCHPLPVEYVAVDFELPKFEAARSGRVRVRIEATAKIRAKTG